MNKASESQPEPKPGKEVVLEYVLQDLKDRAETGKERYGCYLETHNGRDALWDAYQEALDLVMYLRQEILERNLTPATPDQADEDYLRRLDDLYDGCQPDSMR